ncbi:hypothetical protein FIU87_19250 [Bacillus sp. THAF10]|nr:hypothetical protein FIU87_19250 [Bacillus sp. THAF10]
MRKFLYICSAITVICLSLGFSSTSFTSTEMLNFQETATPHYDLPNDPDDPTLPSED